MVSNVETRKLEELMFDPLAAMRAAAAEAEAARVAAAAAAAARAIEAEDQDGDSRSTSPMPDHNIKHFICKNCNEPVEETMWTEHHESLCRNRIIFCPNKRLGCCAQILLSRVYYHLNVQAVDKDRAAQGLPIIAEPSEDMFAIQHKKLLMTTTKPTSPDDIDTTELLASIDEYGCTVERRKDVLVERSKKRRELVMCSGCGEMVQLLYLKRHERELCANRKVPCRNQCVGCNVMVRLKERGLHESVFQGRQTRSCLYLSGECTQLAILEDDIPAPWTAEFWVYKPSAQVRKHY
jgi:hypothetical protein